MNILIPLDIVDTLSVLCGSVKMPFLRLDVQRPALRLMSEAENS